MIEITKRIAESKLKITPDILVTGGETGGAGLFTAFVATLLTDGSKGTTGH